MHIKNVINKQNTHKSGRCGGGVTGIINRLQATLHLETQRCKCWLWLLLQWELLLLWLLLSQLLVQLMLLLLLPFKLLLLLQLFLRPFRGAVSFCLPTFLMPQKKVTHLRQGCHTRHTNLPRHFARPLSLSLSLSSPFSDTLWHIGRKVDNSIGHSGSVARRLLCAWLICWLPTSFPFAFAFHIPHTPLHACLWVFVCVCGQL